MIKTCFSVAKSSGINRHFLPEKIKEEILTMYIINTLELKNP